MSTPLDIEMGAELAQFRRLLEAHLDGGLERRQQQNQLTSINQATQLMLRERYRQMRSEGKALASLQDAEFRCQSQNGEDGIIHHIFSVIGAINKKAIEICAGNGIECNVANLIINHGWEALLFDGDEGNVARGRDFYSKCQDTFSSPPILVAAWITKDNVDSLVTSRGYSGEIDFLSLDLDGMDYWVWMAIKSISPRLVVLEFNPVWGPALSVAVPYDPDFRIDYSKTPYYCSASLQAFVKLSSAKGYRLIGVQPLGFNAFFLRNDLGRDVFAEVSTTECFQQCPALKKWTPEWIPSIGDRPEFGMVVNV